MFACVGAASGSPLQWPFSSESALSSSLTSSTSSGPIAPSRAAFYFILITVTFDFLAFGIIAPVLPDLIRQFQGGDFARASAVTGYFGLAWATMQFIFSPLLGAWSDRFGRRPVVLISCFGLAIDYVFMALAPSLRWLFVGRLVSGITTSNVATAFAYVTDVTPPEKRAKAFGLISAAFGLGFIVGPASEAILHNAGLRFPFWGAAGANAIYGYFILPVSPPDAVPNLPGIWQILPGLSAYFVLIPSAGLSVCHSFFTSLAIPSSFLGLCIPNIAMHGAAATSASRSSRWCCATPFRVLVGPIVKRFGQAAHSGLLWVPDWDSLSPLASGSTPLRDSFLMLWGIAAQFSPSSCTASIPPLESSGRHQFSSTPNHRHGRTSAIHAKFCDRYFSSTNPSRAPPGALSLMSSLLLAVYVTRPRRLAIWAVLPQRLILSGFLRLASCDFLPILSLRTCQPPRLPSPISPTQGDRRILKSQRSITSCRH
jgi:MFS family permease